MHHMRRDLLLLILTAALIVSPLTVAQETEKPVVVCTTTVLASIVKDLAGDLVTVEVIASPAVCPAHYDVRPSDVEAFRKADLILMHGFEPWVESLKEASGSKAPVVKIKGPWNTPPLLKSKYTEVANALKQYLGLDLSERLSKCLKAIDEVDSYLKNYAQEKGFTGRPVVCMLWQKMFISYLGFKIVAVYGPPEKVSAKQYEDIVKNATKAKALLVIDNMQSGEDLGKKIASEVGCVQVALSNFPWTSPELTNMTQVMKWNTEKLAKALEEAELRGEIVELKREIEFWKTTTAVSAVVAAVFVITTALLAVKTRKQ
ncbi:MAG: hypothetical protein DRJ63_03040 [Thermoprotei archaeon]|nr:MAG: hypothetical protein DRJ63_03040 [Thermoprotei archaeon]